MFVLGSVFGVLCGCAPAGNAERPSPPPPAVAKATPCAEIEDPFEQIDCYVTLATSSDDPSACNQAAHEGVKYQCYAILAERRSSTELCDAIPATSQDHRDLRDICISDVAKKVADPHLCERVQSAGLRDGCYSLIGQKTGNKALCEKIQDPGLKSLCSGESVIVP